MPIHTALLEALDRVLLWDLPEEACSDAVASQARLLAGLSSDDLMPLDDA
jgi:hypothetical protein